MADNDLIRRLAEAIPPDTYMIVAGESVTPDQARNIIRRTDLAFAHCIFGKNNDWADEVETIVDDGCEPCLELVWVDNRWIANNDPDGGYGWCHPSGRIAHRRPLHKHARLIEVFRDWVDIAEAFPFLDLGVSWDLPSYARDVDLPGLRIREGQVTVVSRGVDPLAGFKVPQEGKLDAPPKSLDAWGRERECYVPREWFDIWAKESKASGR